jgi:hypothetical protein
MKGGADMNNWQNSEWFEAWLKLARKENLSHGQ